MFKREWPSPRKSCASIANIADYAFAIINFNYNQLNLAFTESSMVLFLFMFTQLSPNDLIYSQISDCFIIYVSF